MNFAEENYRVIRNISIYIYQKQIIVQKDLLITIVEELVTDIYKSLKKVLNPKIFSSRKKINTLMFSEKITFPIRWLTKNAFVLL